MNISFPIIHYTEAQSIEQWARMEKNLNIPLPPSLPDNIINRKTTILKLIIGIIMTFVIFCFTPKPSIINLIFPVIILGIIGKIIVVIIDGIHDTTIEARENLPSYKYFGENIHFLDENIMIYLKRDKYSHDQGLEKRKNVGNFVISNQNKICLQPKQNNTVIQ